jgi:hypothetical protein
MTITGGGGGIALEYGSSTLEFTGSDIMIMAHNFLSHTHSGVQNSGDITKGVV